MTPITDVKTYDGGVLKSNDGGGSWTAVGLADKNVSALAIDPTLERARVDSIRSKALLGQWEEISLTADDEFRMGQLKDIVFSKLIKRGVDARSIEYGKLEPGPGVSVKQNVSFKQGIAQDKAKALVKQFKEATLEELSQQFREELRGRLLTEEERQINSRRYHQPASSPCPACCTAVMAHRHHSSNGGCTDKRQMRVWQRPRTV